MYFETYAKNGKDIKIHPKLKELLEETGFAQYIKPFSTIRENSTEISYNKILGEKIIGMEETIRQHKNNERQINHERKLTGSNEKEVKAAISEIHSDLFGEQIDSKLKLERNAMISGATLPIKINFLENELITETIYVKKPNVNRIIGYFLYNMIRDTPKTLIGFNEKIFVEKEVKGQTLLQEDDNNLLVIKEYREGIGRTAAQAEYLGIQKETVGGRNRIIDYKYNTLLFDFDVLFEPQPTGLKTNHILLYYAKIGKLDQDIVRAYRSEKIQIAERIKKNKKIIFEFAKHANQLKDPDYKTIRQKIKVFSGHDNLQNYITAQTRIFSQ